MNRLLRYFSVFVMLFVAVALGLAQESESIRGIHKVKRKETIFGISRMYDISIEELIKANPQMNEPDFELKKGMELRIPFANQAQAPVQSVQPVVKDVQRSDTKGRAIKLGVMLPLHDINGD